MEDNSKNEIYSSELKRVLKYMSSDVMNEYPSTFATVEHLMIAILTGKDNLGYNLIMNSLLSSQVDYILIGYNDKMTKKAISSLRQTSKTAFNPELKKLMENAKDEMDKLGDKSLTTLHVILSALATNQFTRDLFENVGFEYDVALERIKRNREEEKEEKKIGAKNENDVAQGYEKNINFYPVKAKKITEIKPSISKKGFSSALTINLNKLAEAGKIGTLIGRDKEIMEIFNVLSRMNKNNVILVGDGGCGKTAIVYHLAQMIVDGRVPKQFLGKEIIQLDLVSLIAGTNFRGMFEERIKGLLEEIKKAKNKIVFIDNIHSLLSDKKQSGDIDMSSLLNEALSEGEIQFIGCTNFKEYKNSILSNTSIARQFQKITIEASSLDDTIDILYGIRSKYEKFHGVKYEKMSIETCVKLASKYMSDRLLPDSAIDIMDEVAAAVKIKNTYETEEIMKIKDDIMELLILKSKAMQKDDYDKVDEINHHINLLKVKLSDIEKEEEKKKISVKVSDVYDLVSKKVNIPLNKLNEDEKESLNNINNVLKERIVGQDDAIDRICKLIKRNRLGLGSPNKPIVVLQIGGSGVGKTFMAKQLASEIFGNESYLIRLDMSEYADKTSITRLIGSAPSYVGYNDANSLADKIREKKYCVLLLDEIEKADEHVFNTFLQVFDDGRLTDGTGNVVDFKNVVILLTSNVGTKRAKELGKAIGFMDSNNSDRSYEIMKKELKNKFPPEFLNRLDDIIYFNDLKDDDLKKIITLEMKKAEKQLNDINYFLSEDFYKEDYIDYLFSEIKEEKSNGARPITRLIQSKIIDNITNLILEKNISENYTFNINSERLIY